MQLLNLAMFWKIYSLPEECKINIVFLNPSQFEDKLLLYEFENTHFVTAITKEKIFIKKNDNLEEAFTTKEYQQIIIHECVHMLQMYSTSILPCQQIWLYESIACYMARQLDDCVEKEQVPSWNEFSSSFYTCKNAYYWAYKVGEYIFHNYKQEQILGICRDCKLAKQIGKLSWKFFSSSINTN